MKKWFLMLGLTLGFMGMVSAQEVEVSAKVQSEEVAVGKPFLFDLEMKLPYGYQVVGNEFVDDDLSEQISIVDRGKQIRTADADSNVIVQQQLTLMAFDTGYVQIPPVALAYAKADDIQQYLKAYTKPVKLYVTTITVDPAKPYRTIAPPIEKPLTKEEILPWVLVGLLVLLISLATWLIIKNRKPKTRIKDVPVKKQSIHPYDKAIQDLGSLNQKKLWQSGKTKEYYSSLTDIAREYIEGQFGVNAVEMTTDDILLEVKDLNFDEHVYVLLKKTMQLADLVKFAKCSTSPLENDNAMTDMVGFVQGSYQHYLAEQARTKEEVKDV